LLSLKQLATSTERSIAGSQFSLFSQYYQSDNYADAIVLNILNKQSDFQQASDKQIPELVKGVLTNMVMYMAVLQKLYGALSLCNSGNGQNTDASVLLFDEAVAFYVGSIEGDQEGGRDGGQLLFAVAKNLCDTFNVCNAGSNAGVNTDIMHSFLNTSEVLTVGDCASVQQKIQQEITPSLLVPLFQGTLNAAVVNDGLQIGADNETLADSFTFSRSILPLINNVNQASGDALKRNMNFNPLQIAVEDGFSAVFQAIQTGIEGMTAPPVRNQCQNIGIFQDGSYGDVCEKVNSNQPPSSPVPTPNGPASNPGETPRPSPVPQPTPPPDPTALGFGRYIFVNDVSGVAAIARDIRDIRQADSVDAANTTYIQGKNAAVGSFDRVVSMASLSRTAANDMSDDPMFNIYRLALLDDNVFEQIGTQDFDPMDSAYADIVVQKAFGIASDVALGAESAVVMSVWMEICHELYNSLQYCFDGDERAVLSVDRAIALWIGADQTEAQDNGFLMYSIAQQAANRFGLKSGESHVNKDIIQSFNELQQLAKLCKDDSSANRDMRNFVADILELMTVPLLQNLVYYIDQGIENYVELYALAVIPQAIGCGDAEFFDLRDALISETYFDSSNLDADFFSEMQHFQKCLRITCGELIGNTNPSSTLLDTVNEICYDDLNPSDKRMAGYEPQVKDVIEFSRLDLDILQIGIFMETKAYGAAEDFYKNGFNSQGNLRPYSLQDIATSLEMKIVPQYENFRSYFNSDEYGNLLVQQAIRRDGIFEGASREQAAEAVTRALQCIVSYMAILERFYFAVELCRQGSASDVNNDAIESWERGIALFVGSIEGSERGGAPTGDGTMLYALAKETCVEFGTCDDQTGNAKANEDLIDVMSDGRDLLQNNDCNGTKALIEQEVEELLPVSLFQGALFYAFQNDGLSLGSDNYTLASAQLLSDSVLPLVNSVNSTSANTVKDALKFDLTVTPVQGGVQKVFEAVTFVLPALGVDCENIGMIGELDTCDGEVVNPIPDTPTDLGDGLYTTSTYAQDRADIAKDLVAIKDDLESGSGELARVIYKDGENSAVFNDDGVKVGERSIQSFSTTATLDMVNEPLFNIYKYALQDENGQYLGKDVRQYADTIVNQAFETVSQNDKTLAADAMLVFNIWMYLAHELYQTLDNCRNRVIADTDGIHSIDEAVAYWIGDGQITGSGENGHLFYALAERMGDKFQMDVNGQARTNVNILRLFNQAKLELSFPNACSDNPDTYPRLRQVVYRILSLMAIPLVQSLIDSLRENDRVRAKLFAHAVVPLMAACDPALFTYLKGKLMDDTYNVIEVETIVERIRTSYRCLGITCDDIGQHVSETDNICVDVPENNPLAGYTPSSDVRDYALLDLDIFEADILMRMGAYPAVLDLYQYGKHALVDSINGQGIISLSQLATTSDRSVVPQFDSFVRYYEDNKYADSFVRSALNRSQLTKASDGQRREIVIKSLQVLVLYMSSLQAMHDAIGGCEATDSGRKRAAQQAWDRAAALLIGSMEGTEDGGMPNGQSFFALAKSRCDQFGTCDQEGTANANKDLVSTLYTGKGELQGSSCGALRRTVGHLESLLLIPLIQSNLHFALTNARFNTVGPTDVAFADGFVFSRAVLPLVVDVNRESADTINRNMDFQFQTRPVVDGPGAVFNAFAKSYSGMSVDCVQLGTVESYDPCTGVDSSKVSGGAVAAIVICVLLVVALGVFLLVRRRKLKKRRGGLPDMPEQSLGFRRSKGVMNHDSDLLAGKHNDAAIIDGEEHYGERRMQYEADDLSLT
jgi:hypothetical protein